MRARRQNAARGSNNDENAGGGVAPHHPIAKLASASTAALRSHRQHTASKAKETSVKLAPPANGPRRALGDISQTSQSKANTNVENDKAAGGKSGKSQAHRPLASKALNRDPPSTAQTDSQKPHARSRSASANAYPAAAAEVPSRTYSNPPDVHTASSIAVRLNDQSLDTSSPPSVASSQDALPEAEEPEDEDEALHDHQGVDIPDASMMDARQTSSEAAMMMMQEETASPEYSDASDGLTTASMMDPNNWLALDPADEAESQRLLAEIQAEFEDEVDMWDTTMVAEYQEEIFEYMSRLELATMPNPSYMDHQDELDWSTRTTLLEWLLQIHLRYHMLPETLWIATNIIDRFLSTRQVSLVKLQLVGITAIFLAAKYEEIMAPSVEEFVAITEGGYSKDEILKGERIILQTLEFNISPYCTPYSWVRRISKADDYDIQTRTLCKFLMEVALLDARFLRARPSMIAAIGMYLARKMLGGEWDEAFMFYSGFTELQLAQPAMMLTESLLDPDFVNTFISKKYSTKKHLKASIFAVAWAQQRASTAGYA